MALNRTFKEKSIGFQNLRVNIVHNKKSRDLFRHIITPFNRVRPSSVLVVLLCLFILQGCGAPPPPLKVGSNVWPGYESLYLARSKGFLDDRQIALIEKSNATQVLRDFKAGLLDAAAVTMDEALTLLANGQDIKIVAIMDYSYGADALMVKPEIARLEDLKGKTILVEKTAVGAILLQSALDTVDLNAHQVIVQSLPVNQHLSAWLADDVSAIVTFEPVKTLLALKGGHVLFDSSKIPRRIMDVLVVRSDITEQRPDQIKELLKAHFKALAFMAEERTESALILSQRLNIQPDTVWESFSGLHIPNLKENQRLLSSSEELQIQVAQLKRLMLNRNLLSRDVNTNMSLFSADFLPKGL
ncbi:ABC transporter substrate-binding protein [Oceanospirillum maris]|uniref:ABC transporter substrate-binding protein n=1 Tax=Oceanospirillum maris TaxID=64977 RepID=UPI000A009AA3|nr:ABC transporter substrate-binding protein [Oceanospirillum maris]